MPRRRNLPDRARVAIAQWLPVDGRQLALIVLVVGALAIAMFARW